MRFSSVQVVVALALVMCARSVDSHKDYLSKRAQILSSEDVQFIGGDIKLEGNETMLSDYLKTLKAAEFHDFDEEKFLPAQDFLQVRDEIEKSELYKWLQVLPKGASLHTHILAAVDVDFIVKKFSYLPDLYMFYADHRLKLKFMNASTAQECGKQYSLCKPVKEARDLMEDFDSWLKSKLTLTTAETTKAQRWAKLSSIFTALYDLLTYRPVFEEYFWEALEENRADGILYAEFRGTFMELYELDGAVHDVMESLKIMENVVRRFTAQNEESFIGAKYIYAPYRIINQTALLDHVKLLNDAHRKFPNFVIGFDLVGLEDAGGSLFDYAKDISKIHKAIKFHFHAGESNWSGTSADKNVLDAILLGATRIGHGLTLHRHPELMRLVKSRRIAIEVAPVSNQVLKYVTDLRNHPAAIYAAHGIPIILCNDDPTTFGNVGLTFDYYLAFMAMSPVESDLRFLKATALNSIVYSSLTATERQRADVIFHRQWNQVRPLVYAIAQIFHKYFAKSHK